MYYHIIKNIMSSITLLQDLVKYLLVHLRCTTYTEHELLVLVEPVVCEKM